MINPNPNVQHALPDHLGRSHDFGRVFDVQYLAWIARAEHHRNPHAVVLGRPFAFLDHQQTAVTPARRKDQPLSQRLQ